MKNAEPSKSVSEYTTMRKLLMLDIRNLEDQRDFAISEMERLKRERDEARECYQTAMELAARYKSERDQAWEAFAIATDHCVVAQAKLREGLAK